MKGKVFMFIIGGGKGDNLEYVISNKRPTQRWKYNGYWHLGDRDSDEANVLDAKTAKRLGADRIPPGKIRAYGLKAFSQVFDLVEL